METKASYTMIGVFTLLFLGAIFGFVIWLVDTEINRSVIRYDIDFHGSVAGLSKAADVTYHGLKVGQVTRMRLHPRDPDFIRVTIEVDPATPIREDTMATLEQQGFTGVSYVQLKGGSATAKPIPVLGGEENPIIQSELSAFEELFAGAPDLINAGIRLIADLQKLVDEENRAIFKETLTHLEKVTGTIADNREKIDATFANVKEMTENTNEATKSVRQLADRLDRIAEGDLQKFMKSAGIATDNFADAAEAYAELGRELDAMVAENRPSLEEFTHHGLGQYTRLAIEGRKLLQALNRISERLQRDPARYIFGAEKPETKVDNPQ